MPKTRKLNDLYVVGRLVSIDDGKGAPIEVWLQKLNPFEHEIALRNSNSCRAQVLASVRFKDDTEYRRSFQSELFELANNDETIIEYLVIEDIAKIYLARQAELAAEEKWAKDDYLQGLKDSWNDGMADRFILDEHDEDALAVKEELSKFEEELGKIIESERANFRKDYEDCTTEKLMEMATDRLIESQADIRWLGEYRKCELWLGARDPDNHSKKVFATREEVDFQQAPTLQKLYEEYALLNVDVVEGKD